MFFKHTQINTKITSEVKKHAQKKKKTHEQKKREVEQEEQQF